MLLLSFAAKALAIGFIGAIGSVNGAPTRSSSTPDSDVAGIEALLMRRMPAHQNDFEFFVQNTSNSPVGLNDCYTVSSTNGKIRIEGNSTSGILTG